MMRWLRFSAGLMLFAGLCVLGARELGGAEAFAVLTPTWLVVLSLASLGVLLLNALLFFWLLHMFTQARSFPDAFQLTAFNSLLNSLLPVKAGLAVRGMYMKRVLHFPWRDYAMMTVSAQLLIAIVAFAGLVLMVILDPVLREALPARRFPVTASLLLVAAVLILAILFWLRNKGNLRGLIARSVRGWAGNPALLAGYIVTAAAFISAGAARFYLCFHSMEQSVSFSAVLAIQCLLTCAVFFSVTPGNLGVREGAIFLVAPVMGVDAHAALLAAVLDRAVALAVTAVCGLCSLPLLSRKMERAAIDTAIRSNRD